MSESLLYHQGNRELAHDQGAPQRIYEAVRGTNDVASVRRAQLNDAKPVGIVFVAPSMFT